jgi:hypothetical protein
LHGSQLYRFCSMFLHSLYFFIFRFFFICFIFLLETLWILFMFIKLLIKWNMKYRILCIFCLFMDLVWEKLCFIDYISKVKFLLGLYFHDKDFTCEMVELLIINIYPRILDLHVIIWIMFVWSMNLLRILYIYPCFRFCVALSLIIVFVVVDIE